MEINEKVRKRVNLVAVCVSVLFISSNRSLFAAEGPVHRSTNIKVASDDLEQTALDRRLNSNSDRYLFDNNKQVALGVSDDGDPSLRTRF